MSGSLRKILDAHELSRRTDAHLATKSLLGFFYNSIGIALAVAGVLTPIMAAGGVLLSSVTVVGNSLRLGRTVRALEK